MAQVTVHTWQNQKKWASGKIKSSNKAGLFFIGFFAVCWNAISWTLFFAAFDEMRTQGGEKYMVLLFPLVGLGLLGALGYQLMRQLRFGTSVFEMKPQPGILGGKVGGVIHVPRHIEPGHGFELTLSCIHRYTSGSGKNRSTHENIKWQDQKVIERELLANDLSCTAIPVLFGVPYDALETSVINGDGHLWRLEAKAELPGVDYHSKFEIPVFRTETSDPGFVPESVVVSGYEKPVSQEERLAATHMQVDLLSGGGIRCACPMFRNIGAGLMLLVMGAGFHSVCWLVTDAPLFFRGIFGLVGLGVFWGGLDLLCWKSEIEASRTGMYVQNGLFGLKGRRIDLAEIESVFAVQGCTTNNRVWYTVKLKTAAGKKIPLAKGLPDERSAQALADRIAAEIGLG